MNRTWITVVTTSAAVLAAAGCRSSAPETAPAPAGASSRLTQPAPSVQEIETPLRTASAMPAYVQGDAVPEAEAAAVQPRVTVMPPVEPGRQPGVVESVTLRNEDLHGYAFPGVGTEIPPRPLPTPEVLKTPAPEPAPAPVQVAAAPRGESAPAARRVAHGSALSESNAAAPIEARTASESPAPPVSEAAPTLADTMWAEDLSEDSPKVPEPSAPELEEVPAQVPAPVVPAAVVEEAPVIEGQPVEPPAPVVVEAPVVEAPAVTPAAPVEVEAPAPIVVAAATPAPAAQPAPVAQEAPPVLEETSAPAMLASAGNAGDTAVLTALPAPDLSRYDIGPGDILEFQSYNDTLLGREVTVRYDGQISLPLISDVNVGGLTREEAEALIRDAYEAVFRNPQVSLLVKTPASKSYTVVGDIATPGIYPYTRQISLIEAISVAGGLRPRNSSSSVGGFVGITGQLTKAFIIRKVNGERHVVQYDLRGLGKPGAHASETPVYFGDLIYIPEGVNLVYVLGESRNPVIVELTEGMTMLQLLSLSGGFNESTARMRSVVLMRQVDGESSKVILMNVREMLRTGKDFALNPGDIVYIPRKYMVRIQEFVERFTGTISPVLNLYTDAVNAYYTKDLTQQLLEEPEQNRTLEALANIEQFGQSTSNITELYRRP